MRGAKRKPRRAGRFSCKEPTPVELRVYLRPGPLTRELKNRDRAALANMPLRIFAASSGMNEEPETVVGDFLADLRHWCDAHGVDFALADTNGYGHYVAELGESE